MFDERSLYHSANDESLLFASERPSSDEDNATYQDKLDRKHEQFDKVINMQQTGKWTPQWRDYAQKHEKEITAYKSEKEKQNSQQ